MKSNRVTTRRRFLAFPALAAGMAPHRMAGVPGNLVERTRAAAAAGSVTVQKLRADGRRGEHCSASWCRWQAAS